MLWKMLYLFTHGGLGAALFQWNVQGCTEYCIYFALKTNNERKSPIVQHSLQVTVQKRRTRIIKHHHEPFPRVAFPVTGLESHKACLFNKQAMAA